jgi:aryl-alcohol dehydrogenase-like predicted oxidoreductase
VACPIAERAGVGLSPVALAWAIAKPGVSAAIVGAQSEAQVRGAAAATQLALTTAEQARLDQAFAALPLDRNAGIPMRRRAVAKLRRVARRILG